MERLRGGVAPPLLYALLATRFFLEYIQARQVRFVLAIQDWSNVFYRPFRGILADGHDAAGHPIVWAIVVALGAYMILHAAIVSLLHLVNRPHVETD